MKPDPRFLDPSGWRPTALQLSVPPETIGEPWDRWMHRQVLASPATIAMWLQMRNKPVVVKPKKKSAKKRTNAQSDA